MKKINFAILLMLFVFNLNAQEQGLSSSQKTEIDTYLEDLIKENAPGLAVGIIQNGKPIYEQYLGLANLQHQAPVDEKTRFNMASVAKQFTALCALKLVLENKLSLEDDIRKYLPAFFPNIEEKIQIKHLLNHSSGIRDFYNLMSIQQKVWWRQEGLSNEDAIELLEKQKDLNFQPGSQHAYSNSNYTLLTKIVANISGKSFPEYAKDLFVQYDMKSTHYLQNYMHVIPFQALPYSDWGDGVWQEYPMMTNLFGDGFLFTTLKDQIKFEIAIQQAKTSNNPLLTISQQPIENTAIQNYGYGLELQDRLNYPAVHHSGSTGSYHAQTIRYPEEQLSIVVMSNNGTLWSGFIADRISRILLPVKKVEDTPGAPSTPTIVQEAMSLNQLTGEYLSPDEDIIRIFTKEDLLYWQMDNNNPQKLSREKGNLYHWERNENIKVAFTIKDENNSDFTVYYPGSTPRVHKKMSPFPPTLSYLRQFEGNYHSPELDLDFSLSLSPDNQLLFQRKGKKRKRPFKLVQKDAFLMSDYKFTPQYNELERIGALALTFSQVNNIRFIKDPNNDIEKRQPTPDGGFVSVSQTKKSYGKGMGDILLTKNDASGNEQWYQSFGGTSYDKPSSVMVTSDGGYLIVGSTSSYGKGNYDIWVIKTDAKGKEEWNRTYGKALNEYGLLALEKENQFLIQASVQSCPDGIHEECLMEEWIFTIDLKGNLTKEWE